MKSAAVYVTDSHSLAWYLSDSPKLGENAMNAFEEASRGAATIIVPIIVIGEMIFLVERGRILLDIDRMLVFLSEQPHYEITSLGLEEMLRLREATAIPEMHDRLIVVEAMSRSASVITRDEMIRKSRLVEIVW